MRLHPKSMLACALLGAVLPAGSLTGQDPGQGRGAARLCDSIEAPYAYVRLDGEQGDDSTVERLLADPSLDAVFAGEPASGSAQALTLVRGMIRRGATEFELAMTGIVARGGQPLLVLRASLLREHADRLRMVFEQGAELTDVGRKLGDTQTYYLRGRRRGPGQVVELALVGNDLIVGNDGSSMREVLDPPAETSARPRRVLSADPRYLSLRGAQEVPRGSLLAYCDWQRLGRRLQSRLSGVPATLIGSSGLGAARSVMLVLAPVDGKVDGKPVDGKSLGENSVDGGFTATLLLDFAEPQRAGRGPRRGPGIDGWFAATEAVAARDLLRELPIGGLGGLVLSVDLAAVASHSPRSSHLVWDLRDAFADFGLDFDRNVLARLAARGTVQLHIAPGEGDAVAAVTPVYSVRARNKRTALDLFSDIRRVVEDTALGKFVQLKDDRSKRRHDLLRLGREGRFTAWLGVHGDSLLLAGDQAALVQVLEELARKRPRRRRDQSVDKAIKSIGGTDVAGLFDVDFAPLFERLSAALPGADFSSLPRRHTGYLAIDRREGAADAGPVVRIRLLSSR